MFRLASSNLKKRVRRPRKCSGSDPEAISFLFSALFFTFDSDTSELLLIEHTSAPEDGPEDPPQIAYQHVRSDPSVSAIIFKTTQVF